MALAQLPVDPEAVEVIVRADSAALTHGFVDACRAAQVRFSIGHDLTEPIRTACLSVPGLRWRPAITADGSENATAPRWPRTPIWSTCPAGRKAPGPSPGANNRIREPS
jgi:hypothetical protein